MSPSSPSRAGGVSVAIIPAGGDSVDQRAGDEHRLGDTIAWVHPVTGQILVERSDRTRTAGETLMHWLFPLHSGTAFGTAGMVAMSATGAMPMLFVLTGLWVWLRKRRGQRIGRERRAARAAAAVTAAER